MAISKTSVGKAYTKIYRDLQYRTDDPEDSDYRELFITTMYRSTYKFNPELWFNTSSSMMFNTINRIPYIGHYKHYFNPNTDIMHKKFEGFNHDTRNVTRNVPWHNSRKREWFGRTQHWVSWDWVTFSVYQCAPNYRDYNSELSRIGIRDISSMANYSLFNTTTYYEGINSSYVRRPRILHHRFQVHDSYELWEPRFIGGKYMGLSTGYRLQCAAKHIFDALGLYHLNVYNEKYLTDEELKNPDNLGSMIKQKHLLMGSGEIHSSSDEKLKTYEKLTFAYNSAYSPMYTGFRSNNQPDTNISKSASYLTQFCVENELAWFGAYFDPEAQDAERNRFRLSITGYDAFYTLNDPRPYCFSGIESDFYATNAETGRWSYSNRYAIVCGMASMKLGYDGTDGYRSHTIMLADTNRFIKYMGEGIHYTFETKADRLITHNSGTTYNLNTYRKNLPINRRSKTYEWLPSNAPRTDHEKVWSDVGNDAFPIRKDWYDIQNDDVSIQARQLMSKNYGGYGVFHYVFNADSNKDYTYPNYVYERTGMDNTIFNQHPSFRIEEDGSRNDKYYLLDRRGYLYHYFKDDSWKHHINHRTMDLGPSINDTNYAMSKHNETHVQFPDYFNLKFQTSGTNRYSSLADYALFKYGLMWTTWNGAVDTLMFTLYNHSSLFRKIGRLTDQNSTYRNNPLAPRLRDGNNLQDIPLNMFGAFARDIVISNTTTTYNYQPQYTPLASGIDQTASSITNRYDTYSNMPSEYTANAEIEVIKQPYLFVKGPDQLFKYDFEKLAFDRTNTLAPYLDNTDTNKVNDFITRLKSITWPDGRPFDWKTLYNKRTNLYPFNAFAFFTPNILDENSFVNPAIGINNTGLFGGYMNNPISEFNSPINNGVEYRLGYNMSIESGLGFTVLKEKGGVDGPYGVGEAPDLTYTETYSGWGNNANIRMQKPKIRFTPVLSAYCGAPENINVNITAQGLSHARYNAAVNPNADGVQKIYRNSRTKNTPLSSRPSGDRRLAICATIPYWSSELIVPQKEEASDLVSNDIYNSKMVRGSGNRYNIISKTTGESLQHSGGWFDYYRKSFEIYPHTYHKNTGYDNCSFYSINRARTDTYNEMYCLSKTEKNNDSRTTAITTPNFLGNAYRNTSLIDEGITPINCGDSNVDPINNLVGDLVNTREPMDNSESARTISSGEERRCGSSGGNIVQKFFTNDLQKQQEEKYELINAFFKPAYPTNDNYANVSSGVYEYRSRLTNDFETYENIASHS